MTRAVTLALVVLLTACNTDKKALFDDLEDRPCIGSAHDVPQRGWVSEDGSMPALEGQAVRGTDGLDDLLDLVPRDFEVTRAEELAASTTCTLQRVVEATRDDGGSVFIEQRQLVGTATLFNVPLSGQQSRDEHGSRGELVTDDFNGDGNRLTALVITDTGGWTLVVARGANGPNLTGWPTTMPPAEQAGEPQPAPLEFDEVVDLALAISESTSTRSSR